MTKCPSSPALSVPSSQSEATSQGSLKKLTKSSRFWAIRRYVSKVRTSKVTKECKSIKLSDGSSKSDTIKEIASESKCTDQDHSYDSHSSEHSCSSPQANNTSTTEVPTERLQKRSPSRHNLRALIPTPALDEQLQTEREFKVCSDGPEEEIVTERLEDDNNLADSPSPDPLSALELIGLDHEDMYSDSSSVIDLNSILLEEDQGSDVGPEPTVVIDENSELPQSGKRVTFRNRETRCHSASEVHRRIHILDDLLYSIDLECGASDLGPEPEILFDNFPKSPVAKAECSQEQVTTITKKSVDRASHDEAVIDSLFTPKKKHSCCDAKRKSSWNAAMRRRKSSSQLNMVSRHRPRKVVVIGDMCSGKSALISAYCKDRFNETYVPTILRSCLTDATLHGEKVELVVIETSGRKDYFKLRKCAYRKTDAIILCYSCDNASSLHNIKTQWLPEMKEHVPNVPVILVGTRKDIRDEIITSSQERALETDGSSLQAVRERLVSEDAGYEMAKAIGAHYFIECSARYRDGTRQVFETVAKVAMQKSRRKRKVRRTGDVCSLM